MGYEVISFGLLFGGTKRDGHLDAVRRLIVDLRGRFDDRLCGDFDRVVKSPNGRFLLSTNHGEGIQVDSLAHVRGVATEEQWRYERVLLSDPIANIDASDHRYPVFLGDGGRLVTHSPDGTLALWGELFSER